MGIEQRKGNLYYYEKRRVAGRVVSEYVGRGEFALLADRYAEERAAEKALKQRVMKEERQEIASLQAEIDCLCDWIETLTTSELVASGYHDHKGEWRKRRNETDE